jgi:hypothetical protein
LLHFLIINDVVFILLANFPIKSVWFEIQRGMAEDWVATGTELEVLPIYITWLNYNSYKLFH